MGFLRKLIILAGDVVILYLALIITLVIRYGAVFKDEALNAHLVPFSVIFVIWIIIFFLFDLYQYKKISSPTILFKNLLTAVFVAGLISTLVFYLFGDTFRLTPKTNLFIFSGVFFVIGFGWRLLIMKILTSGALQVVVLGNSPLIEEVVKYTEQNPHAGYRIVQWVKNVGMTSVNDIVAAAAKGSVQIVVIQPHPPKELTAELVQKLLPLEISFINFWDFYETVFEKAPLEELEESWFVENIATRRPIYDASKKVVDFLLALVLFTALLPVSLVIAALVKISSAGPVIYKSERTGKNNRVFRLYKFRTMTTWSGGRDGTPAWTEKNDSRITGLGKIIRFTHLDEIPQLVNILKGDISFTGPRPEGVELVAQFRKFPYYDVRHVIKPGLTGWAQINYKPSASLKEAYEKLRYDIYYIKNRSFFLDLLIILKTVKYVFVTHG